MEPPRVGMGNRPHRRSWKSFGRPTVGGRSRPQVQTLRRSGSYRLQQLPDKISVPAKTGRRTVAGVTVLGGGLAEQRAPLLVVGQREGRVQQLPGRLRG